MTIFVTGAAGFVGFHFVRAFAAAHTSTPIIGFDNVNAYYDPTLKEGRLAELTTLPQFTFVKGDLADKKTIFNIFAKYKPTHVIHMGAQAGVRYSLEAPQTYIDSNITGTLNILEACRAYPVQHLIYASSSSVYGLNSAIPFLEDHAADSPASLYGATKKANEGMAHSYAHLFGIPCTGLRFFTVYGSWGRPDMAFFKFTRNILEGKPIDVYNHGDMARDFTHITDVIAAMLQLVDAPPIGTPPNVVYNIGYGAMTSLMDYIQAIEEATGKTALLNNLPMQDGDVPRTWSDTSALKQRITYKPKMPVKDGIKEFVAWYQWYYGQVAASRQRTAL